MSRRLLLLAPLVLGACTALVDVDRSRLEAESPCDSDTQCDDGEYCNGAEECIARRCTRGADPCADGIGCTLDHCDEETHDCNHEERDEWCAQDPVRQECVAEVGCEPLVEET